MTTRTERPLFYYVVRPVIRRFATAKVWAIYLPGKGLAPSALLDGVGVADPA